MGGESLSTDFDKIVSDCKALNCDLLRIGMLPIPLMGSREKALDFVRRAEECAARLQEHGIALYYHNHHIEFTKYDGETLLEIIRQNTRLLGFELDVHWIQRGGADPLEVIRRFSGRVRLLHLKDYRVTPFQMPEGGFARDGFMNAFTNNIQFAELGAGARCRSTGSCGGVGKRQRILPDRTGRYLRPRPVRLSADQHGSSETVRLCRLV